VIACTYSASSKLMPAVLSETVAVTASAVLSLFIGWVGVCGCGGHPLVMYI